MSRFLTVAELIEALQQMPAFYTISTSCGADVLDVERGNTTVILHTGCPDDPAEP